MCLKLCAVTVLIVSIMQCFVESVSKTCGCIALGRPQTNSRHGEKLSADNVFACRFRRRLGSALLWRLSTPRFDYAPAPMSVAHPHFTVATIPRRDLTSLSLSDREREPENDSSEIPRPRTQGAFCVLRFPSCF